MTSSQAWTVRAIDGPAGRLEVLLDTPVASPRAVAVLAHPHPQHGGTMHNKVVYRSAKTLAQIGCATLRFNFRGVGKSDGNYDEGRGEAEDFSAAVDWVTGQYPDIAVWAAGFSFGAWIALTVGASDARVRLLLGIAPPTHYDLDGLRNSTKPKFLIHGEADELIPLQDMWKLYGELEEPKELVVIDAADHLFSGKASDVGEAIKDLLGDFQT